MSTPNFKVTRREPTARLLASLTMSMSKLKEFERRARRLGHGPSDQVRVLVEAWIAGELVTISEFTEAVRAAKASRRKPRH